MVSAARSNWAITTSYMPAFFAGSGFSWVAIVFVLFRIAHYSA
jgi:hypothetical protein